MATIDIGKISFTQKGTWSSATSYTAKDVVQHLDNGELSSYVAVASSTNQAPSTNGTVNTSYWNLMARGSAISSTNQGTWDSSTAYNKNDVVQYTSDGTHTFVAVQGSTNQAPQTTGTVNTTYWTKLASGVGSSGNVDVLASVDASSSSTLDIDGFFNDTVYGHYQIILQDIRFSSTAYAIFKPINSGSTINGQFTGTGDSYTEHYDTAGYYNQSRRNQPIRNYTSGFDDRLEMGRGEKSSQGNYQVHSGTERSLFGTLEFNNPQSSTNWKYGSLMFTGSGGNNGGNSFVCHRSQWGMIYTSAYSGWRFYPSGGNLVSGTMTLYGFKK